MQTQTQTCKHKTSQHKHKHRHNHKYKHKHKHRHTHHLALTGAVQEAACAVVEAGALWTVELALVIRVANVVGITVALPRHAIARAVPVAQRVPRARKVADLTKEAVCAVAVARDGVARAVIEAVAQLARVARSLALAAARLDALVVAEALAIKLRVSGGKDE